MPPRWEPRRCLPDTSGEFGYDSDQVDTWNENPSDLPPDLRPKTALRAAMFQHVAATAIRAAMRHKNWAEKKLAAETGYSREVWDDVLDGRAVLHIEHLGAAVEALGPQAAPTRTALAAVIRRHEARKRFDEAEKRRKSPLPPGTAIGWETEPPPPVTEDDLTEAWREVSAFDTEP